MTKSPNRPAALALSAAIIALSACALGVGGAAANSPVFSFAIAPSTTQAGAHPDVVTTFVLGNRFNQGTSVPCECNDPKDVTIHTPAGVVANPHVVSECSASDLATFACPPESQVGFVVLRLFSWAAIPLYRTVPQAGQGALFAFDLPVGIAIPQYLAINARTGGDYGLDFKILGFTHAISPLSFATVFWGVPGDSAHDPMRFGPGLKAIGCEGNPLVAMSEDLIPGDCIEGADKDPVPSSLPVAPFTQNPTTCVGPLGASIDTLAYDHGTDHAEAPWPATTGCDKLGFNPSLSAAPTTTEADSASGLAVDLRVPQFQDPSTPSPSEIRAATLTLPAGFSINPNAADGKSSCSDAEANFGNEEDARCPEFSKVGTTSIDSSALPGPIDGYIYLGDPKPGDRYRIVLTAAGFGTNVKIAGSVRPDPLSGQLIASFENLPQAPFQEFDLHIFGSERGILATPTRCGTYPVTTTFQPWAAELSAQTSTQFFTLDSGPGAKPCPGAARPFGPALQAGTADNTAGVHTSFALNLVREDGEQDLADLTVQAPPGFSASLRGVPYCSEATIAQLFGSVYTGLAELSAPSCPAASQIGSAKAGAGAGSRPLYVGGRVYLAGPYKGAPLSLLIVIPAVSGPYDLGNVVVRAALRVDPLSAQVTAVSDPLPQILAGIPLRTRSIEINLDRPDFALNPTNCDPFSVRATISGAEGAQASASSHFQVANCADLPFAPKLSLSLSGGVNRLGHPAIRAVLQTKPGEANGRSVTVTLPPGELLDQSHIDTICTRANFAKEACPAGSLIGSAEALTPLLDRPLNGPVYLRADPEHKLPGLAVRLQGQIEIDLAGRVDSVNGRLRTRFEAIPDTPISRFTLKLAGGSKGLLQNSEGLCATKKRATVRMIGQNGVASNTKSKLQTFCRSKRQKRGRADEHSARGTR